MGPIKSKVIEKIPLIGPTVQIIGLGLDVKEIVQSSTPTGAAVTIGTRVLEACTAPLLFFGGKCVFALGGTIAAISTGGNPLVVMGTF